MKKFYFLNNLIAPVLLIISLCFSLYYGNGSLWLLSILLITLFIFDLIFLFVGIFSISFNQTTSKTYYRFQENIDLILTLNKNAFLNYFRLVLTYKNKVKNKIRVCYFPFTNDKNHILITATNVGAFELGINGFIIYSPFSFFSKKIKLNYNLSPLTVFVYPNIYILPKEINISPFVSKINLKNSVNSLSESIEISGVKPYSKGDRLNLINWKKSFIHKKLFVKNFENNKFQAIAYLFVESVLKKDCNIPFECAISVSNYFFQNDIDAIHLVNKFNSDIQFLKDDLLKLGIETTLSHNQLNNTDFSFDPHILSAVVLSSPVVKETIDSLSSLCPFSLVFLCEDAITSLNLILSSLKNTEITIITCEKSGEFLCHHLH